MKTPKIFTLLFLLFVFPVAHAKAQRPMLQIDTQTNSIRYNNQVIVQPYKPEQIIAVLGKPNRTETQVRKSRYEEYSRGQRSSTMIKVTDTYFIYDALGLMFVSSQSIHKAAAPKLVVYFRKRKFTNTRQLAFVPQTGFTGVLQINGKEVAANEKLVPKNVDFNTNKFELWNTSFGPTSISTQIDRLYSQGASPYLMFYLDAAATQRVSYIEVTGKRY